MNAGSAALLRSATFRPAHDELAVMHVLQFCSGLPGGPVCRHSLPHHARTQHSSVTPLPWLPSSSLHSLHILAADDDVIRQVNADNVLSTAWGPGSHSASGGGMPGVHLAASHPKLLAFKYCCATSPLNHPGRSSPFNSARNSPFNSPRGTRCVGAN
jgi:hypothetical protein